MEGRWILMVPSMLLLPEQRHCIPSEETEDFLSHTSADGCVPGNHGARPGAVLRPPAPAQNPSRLSPLSQPERASARCFPRQLPPAKQLPPDPQSFAVFFALPIKGGNLQNCSKGLVQGLLASSGMEMPRRKQASARGTAKLCTSGKTSRKRWAPAAGPRTTVPQVCEPRSS